MHAELVMIGTELLLGEIVDTNATKLGKMLREIGLDLYYKTTVGDNEDRITDVLNLALDRSDVIITSGGLGPTVDDMTRQAVARATGRELVYSDELEAQIAARFRAFGREMAENNKRQAYIPEGAIPLENTAGTAPCFLSDDVKGRGFIVCVPGVPRELEHMMRGTILPLLIERMGGAKVMKVRVLRTCAVGESNIDRGIGDLMTTKNPTVGLAAHAGQTDVRITAKADNDAEADDLIADMETKLRERLGVAIYGTGEETVAEVVGQLLADKGLQVGIVDTLTQGSLVRELGNVSLGNASFGAVVSTHLYNESSAEAWQAVGIDGYPDFKEVYGPKLALDLSKAVAPPDGIGLALLGPIMEDGVAQTYLAVQGPNNIKKVETSRNFQDTDYLRRWLVIQGLDWVRRAALGEMNSPVDWN